MNDYAIIDIVQYRFYDDIYAEALAA